MKSLNHMFRTIWSEALGAWIAVSEITKTKGKRSASNLLRAIQVESFVAGSDHGARLKPILFAVACCFAFNAQANPMGGAVVNGQASFNTSGNTLTVTNTPGTIINWQGFSINANEVTRFAQQSASSTVLNRVVTNNPSVILGTLSSNGQVYLVNANGIMFGAGSTVDVAGLVATSLNLSNADFLAGRNNYTAVPGAQNVSNAGNINAQQGGQIYLIAPNVENSGIITAPNGEILLAAGNSVQLVNSLDPNLRVSITAPAGNATNLGKLIVESGSLGLFGTMVKNSGSVSADSAVAQGGKIVFKASQNTEVSGTVSATGTTGGDIEILGNQVALLANANVDASGVNGGGTALVGGDAHGANLNVQNALNTYVDAAATIKADAVQNGNGGKVVVWSDNATQFSGNISARGGALSGNGGWVETSGKQWLGFAGLVDTRASNGLVGSLLLDPTDITISTAADSSLTWNGTSYSGTLATGNLNVTTLQIQLGLTNVTVDTNSTAPNPGNITVANAVSWNSANSLTLNALGAGTITTNAGATISNTGTGGLSLITAGGAITLNGNVSLNGGAFTAQAVGGASPITIGSAINTGAGAISITVSGSSITEAGTVTGSLSTTGLLTTSSYAGTTLNGANAVGSFSASNAMTGGISLINAAPATWLIVNGITNFGGGGISVTNAGVISIGGGISGGAGPINLTTTGASGWIREVGGVISTTGTLTTNNSSASGTSLNSGTNLIGTLNATDVGMVYLVNGAPLNVTGITASDVLINNTGLISVSGAVTAVNTVNLNGVGITNNAGSTIKGNLGVSLNAGAGTLSNATASSIITNGGGASTGVINLTADNMTLTSLAAGNGTVIAGAGAVNISNSTLTDTINLGGVQTAGTLALTSADLGTISTTGLVSIGNASNTGAITVSAPLALAYNTALVNGAGGIAINNAITATASSLSLVTTNNILFGTAGSISSTSALNVILNSMSAGTGTGNIQMNAGSSIVTNGGNITLGGGLNPLTTAALGSGTTGTNIYGIYLNGATLNAGAGNISLRGTGVAGSIAGATGIYAFGSLVNTTTGNITLNGTGGSGTSSNLGVDVRYASITAGGVLSITGTGTGAGLGVNVIGKPALTDTLAGSTVAINGTGGISISQGASVRATAVGLAAATAAINVTETSQSIAVDGASTTLQAASGAINLTAPINVILDAAGSAPPTLVSAPGDVNITATTGNIEAYWNAVVRSGTKLTMNAGNGIGNTTGFGQVYGLQVDAPVIIANALNHIDFGINSASNTLVSASVNLTNGLIDLSSYPAFGAALGSGSIQVNTLNGATVSLKARGAILDGNGAANNITATSLNATSAAGIALDTTVSSLTTSNTGAGNTLINNTGALTSVVMSDTLGNIVLNNTGAATLTSLAAGGGVTVSNTGAINITGTIVAAGGGAINLAALGAAGSIIESGAGLINTTGLLTTSSVGGTTLNGANTVGSFNATNSTSGNIALNNTAATLTLTGISETGGGSIAINNTGNISNTGTLAGSGTINLTALGAAGSIVESGAGLINTPGLLTTSSVGGTTLNGANTVGSFNATNSTSGNIALNNTAATLTLTGISETGGGSIAINNTGNISNTGTLAGSGTINLTALGAAGSIIESGAGLINTTGLLTTSSVGGTTLNGANTVGSFNATNSTSGNIALTNTAATLTLTGISETGGGSIAINNTGNISNTGTLAGSGTINLGTGTLTNNGIIAPGGVGTVGTLSITGNLVMGKTGVVNVDLNSPSAGNFDVLNVSGTATLAGGTLNIAGTGSAGSYTVLNAGSIVGTFTTINAGTFTQTPTYAATMLNVMIGAPSIIAPPITSPFVIAPPITPPLLFELVNVTDDMGNKKDRLTAALDVLVAGGANLQSGSPVLVCQ